MSIPACFEMVYRGTTEPIIAYIHDDVMIYEPGWDKRVLAQFEDPTVGVVGFGGALGHGTHNLYIGPYHLPNLARQHFMSNMKDAEKHGQRFTGECDVAVLDGFALFVRRKLLDKWGGWMHEGVGYFLYAEHLCCEARRQGYRIRLVGVDCEHLGGKTVAIDGAHDQYQEAHKIFFDNNRDVMPYAVKP
jgi:GT2 family glycosyltransferase